MTAVGAVDVRAVRGLVGLVLVVGLGVGCSAGSGSGSGVAPTGETMTTAEPFTESDCDGLDPARTGVALHPTFTVADPPRSYLSTETHSEVLTCVASWEAPLDEYAYADVSVVSQRHDDPARSDTQWEGFVDAATGGELFTGPPAYATAIATRPVEGDWDDAVAGAAIQTSPSKADEEVTFDRLLLRVSVRDGATTSWATLTYEAVHVPGQRGVVLDRMQTVAERILAGVPSRS